MLAAQHLSVLLFVFTQHLGHRDQRLLKRWFYGRNVCMNKMKIIPIDAWCYRLISNNHLHQPEGQSKNL